MSDIRVLYRRLRETPWPALAASIGNFALYESVLVGCADRTVRGGLLDLSKVPRPDEATVAHVDALRRKEERSPEETAFLEYYDLLEQIRSILAP